MWRAHLQMVRLVVSSDGCCYGRLQCHPLKICKSVIREAGVPIP